MLVEAEPGCLLRRGERQPLPLVVPLALPRDGV